MKKQKGKEASTLSKAQKGAIKNSKLLEKLGSKEVKSDSVKVRIYPNKK